MSCLCEGICVSPGFVRGSIGPRTRGQPTATIIFAPPNFQELRSVVKRPCGAPPFPMPPAVCPVAKEEHLSEIYLRRFHQRNGVASVLAPPVFKHVKNQYNPPVMSVNILSFPHIKPRFDDHSIGTTFDVLLSREICLGLKRPQKILDLLFVCCSFFGKLCFV